MFGGTTQGKITFDGDSILDMDQSIFDEKFRWKKISMIFQGAMSSLDPVFTINEQFIEILKQHNFEGDFNQAISDSMNSVCLDGACFTKISSRIEWWNETTCNYSNGINLKTKICYC